MTVTPCIISLLAIATSIAAAFRSQHWAPVSGWCALTVLTAADTVAAPHWSTIVFWGIAAAIAFAINRLLPAIVSNSRTGISYMAGGTLAATFVGMIVSQAGMILGAITGAFCGAMAFSRTPSGKTLGFPSARFFNYVCAKGFPLVITSCLCGLSVLYIITIIQSMQ